MNNVSRDEQQRWELLVLKYGLKIIQKDGQRYYDFSNFDLEGFSKGVDLADYLKLAAIFSGNG